MIGTLTKKNITESINRPGEDVLKFLTKMLRQIYKERTVLSKKTALEYMPTHTHTLQSLLHTIYKCLLVKYSEANMGELNYETLRKIRENSCDLGCQDFSDRTHKAKHRVDKLNFIKI